MRLDLSFPAMAAGLVLIGALMDAQAAGRYGLGRVPTADEIAAGDIDVRADGKGLPSGHGSVADGQRIYARTCASCHGDGGHGGRADPLIGGTGTLTSAKPLKTVGSYWPYATTLFDYIRRAMPFNAPQSLSNDEVYAVTAYVLALNGIVSKDATLDAARLPKVVMPNRNGFVGVDAKSEVTVPP